MSLAKPAVRIPQASQSADNPKYKTQAQQLQEIYPTWSHDDLYSLLAEVEGDIELAATRISDGHVEQWGSVSHKKDKKVAISAHASKDSFPVRGDSRGTRSGRGGRGGSSRVAPRGRGGQPRGGPVNGRSTQVGSTAHIEGSSLLINENTDVDPFSRPNVESSSHQNGHGLLGNWTDPSSSQEKASVLSASVSWGGNGNSTWGAESDFSNTAPSVHTLTSQKVSKPTNSKRSWAQVARAKEKTVATAIVSIPAPPPTSPSPSQVVTLPSSSHGPQLSQSELEPNTELNSWEDPTTAQQPPTWEDDPRPKSPDVESNLDLGTRTDQDQHGVKVELGSILEAEMSGPISKKEIGLEPILESVASQESLTPLTKLTGRSTTTSQRNSARYKNTDQPVVMPSSFGANVEKVGMQFGSLNLGGDSLFELDIPGEEMPTPSPETPSPQTPPKQPPLEQKTPPPPPATAPASTSLNSGIFSQQQTQPVTIPSSSSLQSIPAQTPTQVLPQQPQLPSSTHAAVPSPIQHYTQQNQQSQQPSQQHQLQHSLPSSQNFHQHHIHPQHASQPNNQYTQQGLPAHIDPTHASQAQPQQNTAAHSNYFGRSEMTGTSAYFHTPTQVGQGPDSPYGSFGQLGVNPQLQQGSNLNAFGQEYPYNDGQRGFYDSYPQTTFGNRTILGHDDVKGLQGPQQQPAASAGMPPSAQSSQPPTALQSTGQPQGTGSQTPQQYSVPYSPYYGPYPPSQQFYNYPPYGAVPPFKYHTVFQPPAGPSSAPSPVAKQPTAGVSGVQPPTNPYNQGMYSQSGYDDYQQNHHSHAPQHSHSLVLGQGSASDYTKSLYGGQGGVQGFMGLGGQGAGAPNSNSVGPRGGTTPETTYKAYPPKEVGGVAGGRSQQVPGQPQNQGQNHGGQGPPSQTFYGARFAANTGGAGIGAPQQNAHPQGPQNLYPSGGNEGGFYPYRGQQPAYWQ